jgi:hypothetical protein
MWRSRTGLVKDAIDQQSKLKSLNNSAMVLEELGLGDWKGNRRL